MRHLPPVGWLVGVALLLMSLPTGAQTTVAEIPEIATQGLYRQDFSLRRDAEVVVDAIGSGSRAGGAFIAYAWILDRRSHDPIWRMEITRAADTQREGNLRQTDTIRLPPGDYTLFFTAYGGSLPIQKDVKLLKMLTLGSFSISGGNRVRWDEHGDSHEWQASVRLADGTPPDVIGPAPAAVDAGALVRIDRVGDSVYRRVGLDLSAPARFRVLAEGEYNSGGPGFADGGWIEDRESCQRVWEMTLVNTEKAGGAEKNRVFKGEIAIEPGRYVVCFASDDSHAFDAWNSNPPYDPDSWGIALVPTGPLASGAVRVTPNPSDEDVVVKIDRVGDGEFRTEMLRLRRAADFCARGLGEWDRSHDRFLDYGWIEDAYTLQTVWSMASQSGVYAGGESRNRLVEDQVHLAPGVYRVCFVTDEAHSYGDWSNHPPFDPEGWGITLRGIDGFSRDWVGPAGAGEGDRSIIRLAPLRDEQSRVVRFEIPERMTVKLIALGEGDDDEMADYGWLEREPGGETVWAMRYPDTVPGGGADKNRREERVLKLESGRYALHFVTDDSHAFGSWNDSPPDDPQLWGVTLIELPEGAN
jgi:hypothetical protein